MTNEKKRWSNLSAEIKTTLKYEIGQIKISSVDPRKDNFLNNINSGEANFKSWEPLMFSGGMTLKKPTIRLAELDLDPSLLAAEFICRIISVSFRGEETPLTINTIEFPGPKPIVSLPPLELKTPLQGIDCDWESGLNLNDQALLEPAPTFKEPLLASKIKVTYAQRLILKIPFRRKPLDWDRFSKEEICFFWRQLMNKHNVTLEKAELWAVYALIPLNLVEKLWIDNDRCLRMYLHQLTVAPKMVYLIVGRLKHGGKLVQSAVTKAELKKLGKGD